MNQFDLFAQSLDPADPDYPTYGGAIKPGLCCVTGERSSETIPRICAIKPSFTQIDLLRAPDSDRVSLDAFRALTYKWERQSSWIADRDRFIRFEKPSIPKIRTFVFGSACPKAWVGYANVTYHKHGILLARVNRANSLTQIWAWENETVSFESDCARAMYDVLREWQDRGIPAFSASNPPMLTLSPDDWLIAKIGVKAWTEFELWARPKYQSRLYRFMVYLLPSQKELLGE